MNGSWQACMQQVMVTLYRLLYHWYVRFLGYQCITDSIIIDCLIVINGMNDFLMLFHRMCRLLGFLKSGISSGFFGFLLLSFFSECNRMSGQVPDRKSDIHLGLLHPGALMLKSKIGFQMSLTLHIIKLAKLLVSWDFFSDKYVQADRIENDCLLCQTVAQSCNS